MIRRCVAWLLLVATFVVTFAAAHALRADEARVEDEAGEQRLHAIASELRCLVCQNESLAGSNAELAADLRGEIRKLIHDGKSDREIMDFLVARYGDFVRYRPPLKATTWLLWFGPALLFLIGAFALHRYLRKRQSEVAEDPLTAAQEARAAALLRETASHAAEREPR